MAKRNIYKVDFSIDNLTLKEQDKLFKILIRSLDYDARMALHVTVTDSSGGKHFIWESKGIDPNGVKCNKCKSIECADCPTFLTREKVK